MTFNIQQNFTALPSKIDEPLLQSGHCQNSRSSYVMIKCLDCTVDAAAIAANADCHEQSNVQACDLVIVRASIGMFSGCVSIR